MLPWVKVEKEYVFDTPDGKKSLADLFDGRSQLIVYHFMFSPSWKEGCVGCSFFSDHVDGAEMHIKHHDVSFVAISRAPLAALDAYKKRMGWRFNWVSSDGSDFNYDFHVSFTKDELARGEAYYNYEMTKISTEDLHGLSVFFKDETGSVFHHLFVLRPRGRARPWRIHVPRSYAQGPQRNRSQQESDGLGAAPRQVRGGTTVNAADCRFLGVPGDLLLRTNFMRISKHHLGVGFEVWHSQQSWFWFVANTNRNGVIGAAATELDAMRDARMSIEEIANSDARPGWERSLVNLARYLAAAG